MARYTIMDGLKFRRRSLVKLRPEERAMLTENGRVTVRCPVEWPLPDATPDMANARIDRGGTDIWGPGPYLKVPNRRGDDHFVNRVFCPFGYPPDRLRISHRKVHLEISCVDLEQMAEGHWFWLLDLKLWTAAPEAMSDHRDSC